MRYLPAFLNRLFPPVPLMDATSTDHRSADPIARDLDAAITEHERVATDIRDDYSTRLKATIDELLERIGSANAPTA